MDDAPGGGAGCLTPSWFSSAVALSRIDHVWEGKSFIETAHGWNVERVNENWRDMRRLKCAEPASRDSYALQGPCSKVHSVKSQFDALVEGCGR